MSFWGRMFGSSYAEFDQRQAKPGPREQLDFAPFRTPDALQASLAAAQQQQLLPNDQYRQYQGLAQASPLNQQLQGVGSYAGTSLPQLSNENYSRTLFDNIDTMRRQFQPEPWQQDWANQQFEALKERAEAQAEARYNKRTTPAPAPAIDVLNAVREISLENE